MTFNEYQEKAFETALYPDRNENVLYPAMGLCEEAGEIMGKIAKIYRNDGRIVPCWEDFSIKQRDDMEKEIGDALWFLSTLAKEFGFELEDVAIANIEKLADRARRNVICSERDNR